MALTIDKRDRLQVVLLGLVMGTAGCWSVESGPTGTSRTAGLRSLVQASSTVVPTLDDEYSALVREIPGFGGLFYDSTGTLVVYLREPSTRDAVRGKVATFLSRSIRKSPAAIDRFASDAQRMRVVQARFDYSQLLTWYRKLVLPVVQKSVGVTLTDIDERVNRIVVGVESGSQIEPLAFRLRALDVPLEAIEVRQFAASSIEAPRILPALPYRTAFKSGRTAWMSTSMTGTLRPVPGGMKVTHYDAGGNSPCAVSFNLITRVDNAIQPQRLFVSSGHCAYPQGEMLGTSMSQPSGGGAAFIGEEIMDPEWLTSEDTEDCDEGDICSLADAALFRYFLPSQSAMGQIAYPDEDETTFDNTIAVYEVLAPVVGWPAHKIGPVTGRTIGEITQSCAGVRVFHNGFPTDKWMICQAVADYSSSSGDSGGPVIEPVGDGSVAFALGVHWGSGGAFSPLYSVLNNLYDPYVGVLDVVAPTNPNQSFSVSITGPTVVGPNNYYCMVWSATVSSGQTPLQYFWSGLDESNDAAVQWSIPQSGGHIEVYVIDANGNHGIAYVDVTYSSGHLDYCE